MHQQIAAFVWDKKYVEREFELLCSKGTTIFETFLIENLHLIERIKRLYHFNVNDVIVLLVKLYNLTGSRLFFINIWVFVYNIDGWDSKLLSMIVVQAQHFIILWKNTTFTKPAKFQRSRRCKYIDLVTKRPCLSACFNFSTLRNESWKFP